MCLQEFDFDQKKIKSILKIKIYWLEGQVPALFTCTPNFPGGASPSFPGGRHPPPLKPFATACDTSTDTTHFSLKQEFYYFVYYMQVSIV